MTVIRWLWIWNFYFLNRITLVCSFNKFKKDLFSLARFFLLYKSKRRIFSLLTVSQILPAETSSDTFASGTSSKRLSSFWWVQTIDFVLHYRLRNNTFWRPNMKNNLEPLSLPSFYFINKITKPSNVHSIDRLKNEWLWCIFYHPQILTQWCLNSWEMLIFLLNVSVQITNWSCSYYLNFASLR